MRYRKIIAPVLSVLAAGGIATAAFFTHKTWMPIVFPSKAEDKKADEHDHDDHDEHGAEDRVKLSAQAQANLGLDAEGAVGTLTPQPYWRKVTIPGVVVDRPGESDRGVTARTAGIVTAIKARPGDTVRSGEPLFTIQLAGEFVQSVQTDLAKVTKDLTAAITRRDQTKKLVEAGTKPGAELIEEENQVNRLTTQAQGHRRQLLVFGLAPDQVARAERGDAITEVTISAPKRPLTGWFPFPAVDVQYEVQELRVNLGEHVPAGQTLCVLANHQRLFVEGRAFKSEATALALVAEQHMTVGAEFADEAPGTWQSMRPLVVNHFSNQVDTATHTFAFFLSLDNESRTFTREGKTHYVWRFRPGQRVRLLVPVEKLGDDVFVLPAGAIVREGAEAFVFVKAGDVFRRKPVRVLYEDRTDAVIARDGSVSAAEYVVRTPAATALNRAIKAAAAGEGGGGHGHEHGHEH